MIKLPKNLLLQSVLASIFVGLTLQYTSFHGYRGSNYGSSYSSGGSGFDDPWFIGISCALLGLLFVTLLILFVRYVVKRKQERRQSIVRDIHGTSGLTPDNMAGQNPYVLDGYRPQSSQNGWNTPAPNHPWDDNHEGNKWQGALDTGPPYDANLAQPTQPTQGGFTQPEDGSTFVPAFSYGTQFSQPPPQNDRPPTAPVSTIYGR